MSKQRIVKVNRFKTDENDFNSMHKEILLSSIQEARSVEILKFIASVLKLHGQLGIKAAKDPAFMAKCREAYTVRFKQLQSKGTTSNVKQLRQQSDGCDQQERSQGETRARRLFRDS